MSFSTINTFQRSYTNLGNMLEAVKTYQPSDNTKEMLKTLPHLIRGFVEGVMYVYKKFNGYQKTSEVVEANLKFLKLYAEQKVANPDATIDSMLVELDNGSKILFVADTENKQVKIAFGDKKNPPNPQAAITLKTDGSTDNGPKSLDEMHKRITFDLVKHRAIYFEHSLDFSGDYSKLFKSTFDQAVKDTIRLYDRTDATYEAYDRSLSEAIKLIENSIDGIDQQADQRLIQLLHNHDYLADSTVSQSRINKAYASPKVQKGSVPIPRPQRAAPNPIGSNGPSSAQEMDEADPDADEISLLPNADERILCQLENSQLLQGDIKQTRIDQALINLAMQSITSADDTHPAVVADVDLLARLLRIDSEELQKTLKGRLTAEAFNSCDKAGKDFSRTVFAGWDLSRFKFNEMVLIGANFQNATIIDAEFIRSELTDSNFQESKINNIVAKGSTFANASFLGTEIIQSKSLDDCDFSNVCFSKSILKNLVFTACNMQWSQFRGAYLLELNFVRSKLVDSEFESYTDEIVQTRLHKVKFFECNLASANFNQSRIFSSQFIGEQSLNSMTTNYAMLKDATFDNSVLVDVTFSLTGVKEEAFINAQIARVAFEESSD